MAPLRQLTLPQVDTDQDHLHFFWAIGGEADLAPMRSAIRHWLADRPIDEEALDDLLLAVNEAATNAVQHGTPPGGHASVRASDLGAAIAVTVRDQGRWREPAPQVGRGWGLGLIADISGGHLEVRPTTVGTEVAFEVPTTARRPGVR